jgi:hypothetical protein
MLPHDFGDPDKCPARGRAGRLRRRPRFPSAGLPGSGGGQAWQQPLVPLDPESLAVAGRLIDSPARRRCTQQRAVVGMQAAAPPGAAGNTAGAEQPSAGVLVRTTAAAARRRRRVCRPAGQTRCHHSSAVIAGSRARANASATALLQTHYHWSNTVPLFHVRNAARIEIDSLDSEFSETTPSATVLCRIRHEILYARCKKQLNIDLFF